MDSTGQTPEVDQRRRITSYHAVARDTLERVTHLDAMTSDIHRRLMIELLSECLRIKAVFNTNDVVRSEWWTNHMSDEVPEGHPTGLTKNIRYSVVVEPDTAPW